MALYKKSKNWYIEYRYPPNRAGKRIRERVGPNKFESIVKELLEKHAQQCRGHQPFVHNTNVLLAPSPRGS